MGEVARFDSCAKFLHLITRSEENQYSPNEYFEPYESTCVVLTSAAYQSTCIGITVACMPPKSSGHAIGHGSFFEVVEVSLNINIRK